MARTWKNHFVLPDGRTVGYGLFKRGASYHVRFVAPGGSGYIRESTEKHVVGDAHLVAAKLVLKYYRVTRPAKIGWADIPGLLIGLRPTSRESYLKSVRTLRTLLPDVAGPDSITAEMANRFRLTLLENPFSRGKTDGLPTYRRSPVTVASYLRHLSSLWEKHLLPAGLPGPNPWLSVSRPRYDVVRKRVPTDEELTSLLEWVAARYHGWVLPILWIKTKAFTGCRSMDLCALSSSALQEGRLVFPAHLKKERRERRILLSTDLYSQLCELRGEHWLWERYATDAKRYRPNNRNLVGFSARTLFWGMSNIFREFNESRPGRPRLTPHGLKRRAITRTVRLTQSVDATANAIGTTAQTIKNYYLDEEQAFQADDVFRRLAAEEETV